MPRADSHPGEANARFCDMAGLGRPARPRLTRPGPGRYFWQEISNRSEP